MRNIGNMKAFNELAEGDKVWVWWINKLSEHTVTHIEKQLSPVMNIKISVDGEDGFSFHVFDHEAPFQRFIYGTDGWHEYKIISTSKEGVKEFLKETLERDFDMLKQNMENWLTAFNDNEPYK